MKARILSRDVARVVCRLWPVTLADLQGRSRARRISEPRQVAYWLGVRHCGRSMPEVGHYYGRDHTSVHHGVHAVDRRMAQDGDFAAKVMTAQALVKLLRPVAWPDGRIGLPAPMPASATFQSFEVLTHG